eukprot:TRINITY_DN37672_c0_g1_i1.p1 TRINITY_DN37672_c0_g1~~TRINITY_DN37672_c0_g1_i1.p1  ORF type:complete len:336 (+),score=30.04 TRINITY_DN37672_c0_g1_i1:71-1009(+)
MECLAGVAACYGGSVCCCACGCCLCIRKVRTFVRHTLRLDKAAPPRKTAPKSSKSDAVSAPRPTGGEPILVTFGDNNEAEEDLLPVPKIEPKEAEPSPLALQPSPLASQTLAATRPGAANVPVRSTAAVAPARRPSAGTAGPPVGYSVRRSPAQSSSPVGVPSSPFAFPTNSVGGMHARLHGSARALPLNTVVSHLSRPTTARPSNLVSVPSLTGSMRSARLSAAPSMPQSPKLGASSPPLLQSIVLSGHNLAGSPAPSHRSIGPQPTSPLVQRQVSHASSFSNAGVPTVVRRPSMVLQAPHATQYSNILRN